MKLLQPGSRRGQGGDPALATRGVLLPQFEVLVVKVRGHRRERVELALEFSCPGVGRTQPAPQVVAPDGALDWRRGNWDDLIHAPIAVPALIEAALHSYLSSLGLVFGCFDFALTGDGDVPEHWTVIECNPNGQWGWLPDAPAITEAFADILSRKEVGPG
ncbi:hypothetical protein [Streptomyces sp. NPDC058572]|uniref:hypothetical protein n=1 Tax=Streptomyces sp. NPDC058572 TaxID=3346546 RepID=UPI0036517803